MKTVSGLNFLAVLVCLSVVAPAQSQFAGKWQTKISPARGKHSITLNIVVNEDKVDGKVVLVNPDRSESESPILNPELKRTTLKFETSLGNDKFNWRLTVKKGSREGLLHGSVGEMLIDERVVKQR